MVITRKAKNIALSSIAYRVKKKTKEKRIKKQKQVVSHTKNRERNQRKFILFVIQNILK